MRAASGDSISVVIQGPVFGKPGDPPNRQLTERCITSIHQNLPGAEIILSTWEDSDVSHLTPDILVFSRDPGALPSTVDGTLNNLNRQIKSTQAGLLRATRPFAIKMRADMMLEHAGFLDFFDKFPIRPSFLKTLKKRVICPTFFTCGPSRAYAKNCFHPSDWFHFGLREDLLAIWDIPLAPEPETSQYFLHTLPPEDYSLRGIAYYKYSPEQYIWLSCLRRKYEVEYEYMGHVKENTIALSTFSIINNFILLEPEQMGLKPLKSPLTEKRSEMFSHEEWLAYYQQLVPDNIL